ncbi:MAG: DUF5696 domain-containing protein [Acutalibacteraceae bacterium]|jgi:hypothetical protein
MRKIKMLILPVCVALLLGLVPSFGTTAEADEPFSYGILDYGSKEDAHALKYDSPEAMLKDMTLMATSANLELYVDQTNLNVALKNRKTGTIVSSNPYNAEDDEKNPGNSGEVLKQMLSQVELDYTAVNTGDDFRLYSRDDCVDYGQFIVNKLEDQNGFEVIYSLGKDLDNQIIPDVMTEESYNWILDQLNDPAILEQLEVESIDEIDEFIGKDDEFNFPVYTRLDWNALDDQMRSFYKETYTNLPNTVLYIAANDMSPFIQETLLRYLTTAGYNHEMKMKDLEASGYKAEEGEVAVSANFKLTLRYLIDDDHFYVEMDGDKIEYNTEYYRLEKVTALRYFGASTKANKGYVFLPDGSGAIIAFDDPALERPAVLGGKLYGDDNGTTYPRTASFSGTYHLPVFGIKVGDNAVFGIIQQGDGLSSVYADIGGVRGTYYCAYPIFTVRTKDSVRVEKKAGTGGSAMDFVEQYAESAYKGQFRVQYNFLSGDKANYMGMAERYREYLAEQGMTQQITHHISFQMNTLGAVQYAAKWGFIPYTATAALTTYEDDQTMIEEFKKAGITDFDLQLLGWQKSGLDTMALNKYRASSKLGGTDALKGLINYCADGNIGFYPQADLMYVQHEGWFDGFSARANAVRLINNQYGTRAALSPTYGTYIPDAYALAPTYYADFMNRFLDSYTGATGGDSLNLARMGLYLNSDFKKGRTSNRQQSLETVRELLNGLPEDLKLAFNGGNAYVLPYADRILDVPLASTGTQGETYDIPFLQMVMLGRVTYAAEAINTASDRQDYLLRCIESQSAPSFNLLYQNADVLKSTEHTRYYNVDFAINKDDFIGYYTYVTTALSGIVGETMTDHTRLSENVVRIRYANGETLYINYGKTAASADGHTLEAQSYLRASRS